VPDGRLAVRPMSLDEVSIRIAYFHDSSYPHLLRLGVNRVVAVTSGLVRVLRARLPAADR
jgi:hypothetical protein